MLIYRLFGVVKDAQANLEDISLELVDLPPNMEIVSKNLGIDLTS